MFLLGDSHTRSYVLSDYVQPVFIGSGRQNNLSSKFLLAQYVLKLCLVNRYLRSDKTMTLGIVIGEPDVRIACFGDYWVRDNVQSEEKTAKHIRCVSANLRSLLIISKKLRIRIRYIVGAGTPNEEIYSVVRKMNLQFSEVADRFQVPFFDPQSSFDMADDKHKYLGKSVFNPAEDDLIHFSKRISRDLDKFLQSNQFDTAESINLSDKGGPFCHFKFKKEFGCYVCVYGRLFDIFFRILNRIEWISRRFF